MHQRQTSVEASVVGVVTYVLNPGENFEQHEHFVRADLIDVAGDGVENQLVTVTKQDRSREPPNNLQLGMSDRAIVIKSQLRSKRAKVMSANK